MTKHTITLKKILIQTKQYINITICKIKKKLDCISNKLQDERSNLLIRRVIAILRITTVWCAHSRFNCPRGHSDPPPGSQPVLTRSHKAEVTTTLYAILNTPKSLQRERWGHPMTRLTLSFKSTLFLQGIICDPFRESITLFAIYSMSIGRFVYRWNFCVREKYERSSFFAKL